MKGRKTMSDFRKKEMSKKNREKAVLMFSAKAFLEKYKRLL